jgi:hypothetical protein
MTCTRVPSWITFFLLNFLTAEIAESAENGHQKEWKELKIFPRVMSLLIFAPLRYLLRKIFLPTAIGVVSAPGFQLAFPVFWK